VRVAWIAYLVVSMLGELALAFSPAITALIDATVLVVALSHFGWAQRYPVAIGDPVIRLLPAISLIPLLRLLSLTLPVPDMPPTAWLAITAGPLLLAVVASARLARLDVGEAAIATVSRDLLSILVVLVSMPAGILVGWLSPLQLFGVSDSPVAMFLVAAVLVGGAAIPEELVFRGVLQPLLADVVGRAAPLVAALAFASTYIGAQSPALVAVMAGVGLGYGWEVMRSGSLWAPIVGHSVLLLVAVFLTPQLLR
jgi:membrane protease YdiL (CAAX protease family)